MVSSLSGATTSWKKPSRIVEVWKIDKAVLVDWMPAQSLPYKGVHGMKLTIPVWENK